MNIQLTMLKAVKACFLIALINKGAINKSSFAQLLSLVVYLATMITPLAIAQPHPKSASLAPTETITQVESQAKNQGVDSKKTPLISPIATQVRLTPQGQLSYQGLITFSAYQNLVKLYEQAIIKPTSLHINSLGGDGLAGILLGKFVFQHHLHLVIADHCMSSCANFVFTSSPHITLGKNALVVFHGSFYQANLFAKFSQWYTNELQHKPQFDLQAGKESSVVIVQDIEKSLSLSYYPTYQKMCSVKGNQQERRMKAKDMANACVRYLRQQEAEHFNNVSVAARISTWGQSGGYKAIYESYQYIGFYYSLEDLNILGVKNITIKDGESWSPYPNPYYAKVYPATLGH